MRSISYGLTSLALLVLVLALIPRAWWPDTINLERFRWFGAPGYTSPPETKKTIDAESETVCPEDLKGWRSSQVIEGVKIARSPLCKPDNPHAVAAFVKGTNRVSHMTLMESNLAPDAVEKGRDLDGDGDPDEIHIRLEVMELNGASGDAPGPVVTYDIAPGVQPGFWVFTPKMFGMATENFSSLKAMPMLRVPSPAIRVEQGDTVKVTLENTHYMPHTIHFHGVDHPYLDENGEGNDGVPQTSEHPVMPGQSRTYDMSPRHAGTMFYHCHVKPDVHILMGLQGLFIVEENKPNNWLQTLNVGAGHVRSSSVAVSEEYDREYDLHYQDLDKDLHASIQQHNDPRVTIEKTHQSYDVTDAKPDYFLLNGRSFPYTVQESALIVGKNENVKLRVVNGGSHEVYIHTHGHKVTITDYDGVSHAPIARITRDVVSVGPAQRVDLALNTSNDGLHSYGEGVWLFHDHKESGVTTDGISPGGGVSVIAYESFLDENGFPIVQGIDWKKFFTVEYYQRKTPIWQDYDPDKIFGNIQTSSGLFIRLLLLGVVMGLFVMSCRLTYRALRQ